MVSGMAQDGGLMNMARDKEKVITYELHIEDMPRSFGRLCRLLKNTPATVTRRGLL